MPDPSSATAAQTGYSRVFLIEGRARPDHQPEYQSWMKAAGIKAGYGDIEQIEVPSADVADQFDVIGSTRKAADRPTTSLSGRYAADVVSRLRQLAQRGCACDVQIHIGNCTPPSDFSRFLKALVLEEALITSWETEDLGALSTDERAKIDESSEVSAARFWEIVPIAFSKAAESLAVSEVIDVVFAGTQSCGTCGIESNGADHIYAVTKARTASPGLAADLLYSLDGGASWNTSHITSLGSNSPTCLAVLADYVMVFSADSTSVHIVPLADLDTTGAETWEEVTTGFVGSDTPNDASTARTKTFIAAANGYVYRCDNALDGVEAVQAGDLTTEDLLKIHALTDGIVVAVGANNAVIKTTDGEVWTSVVGPLAGQNLTAVWAISALQYFVGTATGRLFYTLDGGNIWQEKRFTGSGTGVLQDIAFANRSVGYISHTTAASRGRLLRTYDGGFSWMVLPEAVGSLPAVDRVSCLAAPTVEANMVVGGCLADDATDGLLLIGQ